jgi:hypothetical protein
MNWKIEKIVSKGAYNYAIVRDHPNRTKKNYVLEHRVVMENHIGRLLTSDEVVHHINEDKKDNRIENLSISSLSEHTRHHQAEIGRLHCKLKCPNCEVIFDIEKRQTFLCKKTTNYTSCSRKCGREFALITKRLGNLHDDIQRRINENLIEEYRVYNYKYK